MQNTETMMKMQRLTAILQAQKQIAVAFSGGTDSAFLLAAAQEACGGNVTALTARSCLFPQTESDEAEAFCRSRGIRQIFCDLQPLDAEAVRRNPPDRCYHCKKLLFTQLLQTAAAQHITFLAEGTNLDDTGDYRPGLRALDELGIRSPLREAGLTKAEIRQLSAEMRLPTWNKPALACLATRIPYHEPLTPEKLRQIEQAEQYLTEQGFLQKRVRMQGDSARIELLPEDFARLLGIREQLIPAFRALGFVNISLDLRGYRTGSMNEML